MDKVRFMSKGQLKSVTQHLTSFVCCSLLLLLSGLVSAAPVATPADWLARMVAAPSVISYQGSFLFENTSGLTTVRVAHQPDGQRERLVYLDGPYREVIRKDQQVAFVRPDGDVSQRQSETAGTALVERLGSYQDDLRRSYRLLFGGDDRVAGRTVTRIEVQPRDSHRYGYLLWLDKETGVLLKSEMIGDKNAVLERFQFTDFYPGPVPETALAPSQEVTWAPSRSGSSQKTGSVDMSGLGWEAGWIPAGFQVIGRNQVNSPVSKHKVDSILFSDGLAAFSVFVEEDHSRVIGPASEQIGATSAISRIYRKGGDYFNVTVIGELPLGTTERIAVSVRPLEGEVVNAESLTPSVPPATTSPASKN